MPHNGGSGGPAAVDPLLMGTSGASPTAGGSRSTAHVTAVPRGSANKVSGGTQTSTADLSTSGGPSGPTGAAKASAAQPRSCSLTGPTAAQLNQSLRERLASGSHSLPKQHHQNLGGSNGAELHLFQQQHQLQQQQHQHHRMSAALGHHHHHQHHQQHRGSVKLNDGSVSDTQTYVEVKPDYSSYAAWLKHSNTANSRLSECDSMESLALSAATAATAASSASGGLHHGRGHKLMHRDSSYSHSPRLNRSNSIR